MGSFHFFHCTFFIVNPSPLSKVGSCHARAKEVDAGEGEAAEHEEEYGEAEEDVDRVPHGEEHPGRARWFNLKLNQRGYAGGIDFKF